MIALIPARAGSKGIPGKNIRELVGLPLIAHTIYAAKAAREIHRVVVSTDSAEIRQIASHHGAEVPFLRPDELATDTALAIDVYRHAVEQFKRGGDTVESFCVLQPTSPLRRAQDIDGAVALFHRQNADAVISVRPAPHPINWYRRLDSKGVLSCYFPEGARPTNRQEEEALYIPNGAIYVFRTDFVLQAKAYYSPATYGFVMPADRSVDIDDLMDLRLAEMLLRDGLR